MVKREFQTLGRLGLAVSYECGAVLAALQSLRVSGQVSQGESVLLLMTASHFVPLGQAETAGG